MYLLLVLCICLRKCYIYWHIFFLKFSLMTYNFEPNFYNIGNKYFSTNSTDYTHWFSNRWVWTVGVMIYFTCKVYGSSPGWPSYVRKNNRINVISLMHVLLGSGDITRLYSCNWVVVITGWKYCPGDNRCNIDYIIYSCIWFCKYDNNIKFELLFDILTMAMDD